VEENSCRGKISIFLDLRLRLPVLLIRAGMKVKGLGWLELMVLGRRHGVFSELMSNSIIWKNNFVAFVTKVF
jgi:hypothetical protein